MSVELTTQALAVPAISQPEKHILTVLCFLSNQHHEVYRSIEKLSQDCCCSVKTIERVLKKFRDKGILVYTGKIAPKSKNIPIYRINLNHGLSGGGKDLTTDSQSSNHGLSGNLITDSEGIWIDNTYKDNKKDNSVCGNLKKIPKENKPDHTHNKIPNSSLTKDLPTEQPDTSSLRSRCLTDKDCLNRFKSKFHGYNVTIEQLLDECIEHYNGKVTANKFLKWIGWEKIENHAKVETKEENANSVLRMQYQEYVTLAKSEPNRQEPILPFNDFMLSLKDKR